MRLKPLKILILCFLFASPVFGDTTISPRSESHFRFGLLSGTFQGQGQAKGAFSLPSALDVEYNTFKTNRKAFALRAIMGMEMQTARVRYTYAGIGQRYFIGGPGIGFEGSDTGNTYTMTPKLRYYAGWDLGVAQVLVLDFGPVLATYSTLVDYGVCGGVLYQVFQNLGVEAHAGYTMGNGFSIVTVTATTMRVFLGLNYSF